MKIYYRFCDKNPAFYNGKEISKFKCFDNFVSHFNPMDINLILDNCNRDTFSYFFNYTLRSMKETSLGNCNSFKWMLNNSVDYSEPDDIIYLVEDDYIHREWSYKCIKEGLEIASFVTLYDHADKYGNYGNPYIQNRFGEKTNVFLTQSSHWKFTNSTTMTFATKAKTLLNVKDRMVDLVGNNQIPNDFMMWDALLASEYYTLANPIPARATHLCKSKFYSPLINWEQHL